jgi:photosystem II stability/assembly factor-like uncharacterized protein
MWFADETNSATRIFHTADGGRTWRVAMIPMIDFELGSMQFVNDRTGWIMLIDPPRISLMKNTLFRTNDSGRSWRIVESNSSDIPTPNSLPWCRFAGPAFC